MTEYLLPESNPVYNTCLTCGAEYCCKNIRPGYCSNHCKYVAQQERNKANKSFNVCPTCGKNTHRDKYCSKECFHTRNVSISTSGEKLLKCSDCHEHKPMTNEYFYKSKNADCGFKSQCKPCSSEAKRKWLLTDHAKSLVANTRKRNIETSRSYAKSRAEKRNNAERDRKRTDPNFALRCRMRVLMHMTLRQTKNGRKWQDLVGYSIQSLKDHIEKQFNDGMNWDRFLAGDVHIDHIIPVSAFNYTDPSHRDFHRCWALKNLRPMWATDNLKKSNRLEKHFQPSLAI